MTDNRELDERVFADPRSNIVVSHRPWGSFEQFVLNQNVTVKILTVLPGEQLSLQTHAARGELWKILDVPLEITAGDRTWVEQPAGDVWIPCGTAHRIANPSEVAGRVLEVAFGDFDEDDIQRLDDAYGRLAQ